MYVIGPVDSSCTQQSAMTDPHYSCLASSKTLTDFSEGKLAIPIGYYSSSVEFRNLVKRRSMSSTRHWYRSLSWHYFPRARPIFNSCQVIYSQFGLAIHQNDQQARRRFVEWAQNENAVIPDFHKRILFSDEAHFWLNGYVNKQNCRIWSEDNSQVYVETPLHPEKLTVWCALWAGGILLQKR
ncbi:uncharacterized protein TNCV_139161 [Trichonephila clavipes]|nr:uncharacterized protein TNCV_139161 [Trichonephila clavipes]